MFNFKASGIAAGTAFVLSLLVGIISGSGVLVVLVRALLFGVLFFALTCLVFWLLGQFLPELLTEAEDDLDIPSSGSHVNITVGGPISGAFPTDTSETVDDISGRAFGAAAPLDQGANAGYTEDGSFSDGSEEFSAGANTPKPPGNRGFSPANGPGNGDAELLPDMDGLSEAAASQSGGVDVVSFDPEPARKLAASNRGKEALGGDFNPKDLARGIQTILKKDDKG